LLHPWEALVATRVREAVRDDLQLRQLALDKSTI
jgi:hypothetical protein